MFQWNGGIPVKMLASQLRDTRFEIGGEIYFLAAYVYKQYIYLTEKENIVMEIRMSEKIQNH